MYFPVGWPKVLCSKLEAEERLVRVICNRDRIFFAVLSDRAVAIWLAKPQMCLTCHRRSAESVKTHGTNINVQWRPDSSMLVVSTSRNYLLFFHLAVDGAKSGVYNLIDSPQPGLRRESAELFIKDDLPALVFSKVYEVWVESAVTAVVGVRDELMVATADGRLLRFCWTGQVNVDYCVDLRRTPFSLDQHASVAVPIQTAGVHVTSIEYSPLIGGFASVLSDGRAAFITASSLKFDPNSVQGVWARDVRDATCACVNHKYRLLVFGRSCGECVVCCVDETTGGLQTLHSLVVSSRNYPQSPTTVAAMRWTPDGCALAVGWCDDGNPGHGTRDRPAHGVSVWSVFGTLLFCSLCWENSSSPSVFDLEWAAEGYNLWMLRRCYQSSDATPHFTSSVSSNRVSHNGTTGVTHTSSLNSTSLMILSFVKASLSSNPCVMSQERVCLQSEDRVYVAHDQCDWSSHSQQHQFNNTTADEHSDNDSEDGDVCGAMAHNEAITAVADKHWLIVDVPHSYLASNWPIRYTAVDAAGDWLAVAGRLGVARYSLTSRRWTLFGNETQERDFVVTGGVVWWRRVLLLACYNVVKQRDEVRLYPLSGRLDDSQAYKMAVAGSGSGSGGSGGGGQVLLLSVFGDTLVTYTSDSRIVLFHLQLSSDACVGQLSAEHVSVHRIQDVDISALTLHPACVVSVCLSSLRTEPVPRSQSNNNTTAITPASATAQSLLVNVGGRLLMLQRDSDEQDLPLSPHSKMFVASTLTPTVLASMVESVWCPGPLSSATDHNTDHNTDHSLADVLWINSGRHGLRVWLPLFPTTTSSLASSQTTAAPSISSNTHCFMAKRIMLPLQCDIYPLSVKYDDAVILGAEADVLELNCSAQFDCQPPYCLVERTSQVYLQHILRQLLRRNLGHHAWQLACRCTHLAYFGHALELLLHEVVEEEATCKEPIPDALLPRVIAFIAEFPHVYLDTVVQCARKTEMALWSYLFASAGAPAELFRRCVQHHKLHTAASYLIILQNLESCECSCQYAVQLLDASLERAQWKLARDLVRFLRAIDPSELDDTRECVTVSKRALAHITPPVSPTEDDLSLVYGSLRVRQRSVGSCTPRSVTPGKTAAASADLPAAGGGAGAGGGGVGMRRGSVASPAASTSISSPDDNNHRLKQQQQRRRPRRQSQRSFVEACLERHAERLLTGARLWQLGRFAALMQFRLVEWLRATAAFASSGVRPRRQEKMCCVEMTDPVAALRQIHADFHWSWPALQCSVLTADTGSSSVASAAAETVADQLQQQLYVHTSTPADSGYASVCEDVRRRRSTVVEHVDGCDSSLTCQTPTEALLMPSSRQAEVMSVMSDCSSLASSATVQPVSINSNSDITVTPPLLPPTDLIIARGSRHSELQLRYLLQIFLEAECVQWSLLLALVLSDSMAVVRAVNLAACLPDKLVHRRLASVVQLLYNWAQQHCSGYCRLLVLADRQLLSSNNTTNATISSAMRMMSSCDVTPPATGDNNDADGGGGDSRLLSISSADIRRCVDVDEGSMEDMNDDDGSDDDVFDSESVQRHTDSSRHSSPRHHSTGSSAGEASGSSSTMRQRSSSASPTDTEQSNSGGCCVM